jgi:VWFA-related protein
MGSLRRFCVTMGLFAGFGCWAQTPSGAKPPGGEENRSAANSGTVLRTTTRLVQLDVIVEDKRGKPVENLLQTDFTLLDNGKPQAISLFSTETDRRGEVAVAVGKSPNEPAANVFGNRIHRTDEGPGSVTVVLFDALNTSITDQSFAKTEILAFLRQLRPQDHVAIYLLTNKLVVINEFTQDSKSLLQAIGKFQNSPSLLLSNSSQPNMSPMDTGFSDPKAAQKLASMVNDMNSKLSDLSDLDRVQTTARAIEAIANHVSGIPGRKNLVWVSGSFPVSISFSSNENSPIDTKSQNFAPELERVARALNQSNMAVYPVDARGLLIPSEFDASRGHPFGRGQPATETGVGQDEQVTMELLAERTGGHAYRNTNDIRGAIRRTLAESRFTYLIGFYPENGNWNGEFHELKLRLKESGLVVRYRKGYYALPDPPDTVTEARNALQAAFWSPVDATSLGIEAKIQRVDLARRKLDMQVRVDASQLQFGNVNGKRVGNIDAIYLQIGPGDAVVTADPLTYKLNLSEKDYQTMLERGYELKVALLIQPTTMALRVLVRDGGSGALGSVTIPLANFLPQQSSVNHPPDVH